MEFAKEVLREVICERSDYCQTTTQLNKQSNFLENESIEAAAKEAEIYLSNGLSIAIHILLGHDKCNAKQPKNCKSAYLIEVWTLQITSNSADSETKPQMIPLFLKQAIRSQLYFSPTKSWFSKIANAESNNDNLLSSFRCIYKIETSSNFQAKKFKNIPSIKIDEHKFPPCKVDNRSVLNVKVEWLKKDFFPIQAPLCSTKKIENDEWILPEAKFTDGEIPTEIAIIQTQNIIQGLKRSLSRQGNNLNDSDNLNEKMTLSYSIKDLKTKKSKIESRKSIIFGHNKIYPILREPYITPNLNNPQNVVDTNSRKPLLQYYKPNYALTTQKSLIDNNTKSFVNSKFHVKIDKNYLTQNIKSNYNTQGNFYNIKKKVKDENLCQMTCKNSIFNVNLKSTNNSRLSMRLLCNFEESALKGRLHPIHSVNGFKLQIVTGSSFSSRHFIAPVTTFYFNENAPSLYMGICNLSNVSGQSKMGIQLSKQCILQAILFNPQGSVVKIFLVNIDVNDMPPLSQTFIRQKTLSTSTLLASSTASTYPLSASNALLTKSPQKTLVLTTGSLLNIQRLQSTTGTDITQLTKIKNGKTIPNSTSVKENLTTLKFLIHLRLASDCQGRIFLHKDVKMLLSNKSTDLEGLVSVQTQSTTQMPQQPKYSSIK